MIASESDPGSDHVLKRLSVSHLPPSSSSPFPSPSSSFLPPPVPSNHEFANLAAWSSRKKSPPPTAQSSAAAMATAPPLPIDTAAANALLSPTATSAGTPTPQHTPTQSTLTPLASPRTSGSFTPATPSHSQRSSLSASRAAPPSPVPSRRPSMRRSASRRSQGSKSSVSSLHAPKRSRTVKIRDYAYPVADARHTGAGADADKDRETPSRRSSGWGAFRWSGITSKLPWSSARPASPDTASGMPSQSDFDRNFSSADDDTDDDTEPDAEAEGEYAYDGPEGELRPGWYRALYAFEPEGTAEMALREDQHVRVLGRGGGVGWAVARVEGGEGCALVPESYLEWRAPFQPGEEEGYDSPRESELTYHAGPHTQERSGGHTPRGASAPLPG